MPASSPVGIISHCPRPLFGRRDRGVRVATTDHALSTTVALPTS